jgi:predicted nucleotidyltransferase
MSSAIIAQNRFFEKELAVNTVAIICEYNPFHNGHLHHLSSALAITGARRAVLVMSGSWMQRGEPAIVDKWSRARMALAHGANIVIELPAAHALRAADDFAKYAVALLDRLGVCTHLCFGSELPLEKLEEEAGRAEDEGSSRKALANGESYPRAVGGGEVLSQPNATLGVAYLKARRGMNSRMEPVTIRRTAPHDGEALGEISSASAIRRATFSGVSAARAMPPGAHAVYRSALARQGGPAGWERLAVPVLRLLRGSKPEELAGAYGIAEGLERRFLAAARDAVSVDDLLARVKTKRYTHARLRRALCHMLLGFGPEVCAQEPTYARVLGFRKESASLLREIDRRGDIPLLTKLPKETDDPLLLCDLRAQETWALACPLPFPAASDYRESIVMLHRANA